MSTLLNGQKSNWFCTHPWKFDNPFDHNEEEEESFACSREDESQEDELEDDLEADDNAALLDEEEARLRYSIWMPSY